LLKEGTAAYTEAKDRRLEMNEARRAPFTDVDSTAGRGMEGVDVRTAHLAI
jgi:hypothetical protein